MSEYNLVARLVLESNLVVADLVKLVLYCIRSKALFLIKFVAKMEVKHLVEKVWFDRVLF